MQAHSTKLDLRVLGGTGTVLLALAGVFLWRDLDVPASVLAAAASVVVALLSTTGVDRRYPLLTPVSMVLLVLGAGGWYVAVRDPILLAPLGVIFLAAIGMVVREPAEANDPVEQVRRFLVWYGMVLAALAASWAASFELITLRVPQDAEAHRLLLTAAWMGAGVFLIVLSRWRALPAARDAGFAFLAAGVGKLVFYDASHVHGLVRIAGLAGAGAVLLLGAWLAARLAPRAEVQG